MRTSVQMWSAILAGALVIAVGVPAAEALNSDQIKCQDAYAKEAAKFVKKKLKAIQKCNNKNLKEPGDCTPAELSTNIAELAATLNAKIDDKCSTSSFADFFAMGFPDSICPDFNPSNGFTRNDLKACMHDSHEAIVDSLIDIEYGGTTAPLDSLAEKCQEALAKQGEKFLSAKLKAVQKCRSKLNKNQLFGFAAKDCATADSKTQADIAKAESKARANMGKKCTAPAQITALDVCDPPATTVSEAEDCIIATHGDAADDPDPGHAGLTDFEYASPNICGDNVTSPISEECDGTSDTACPGACGSPTGFFPCMCTNVPRERVVEHANADLDNGWTGKSHDSGVVEGGGYLVDLYDCDGPAGPDTLCTVGPSCTGGSHAFCTSDAACGVNGPCRKTLAAVGPHCRFDLQQTCTGDGDCPGLGNKCVKTFHGPPLPLSAGSVSVCVINTFTENVVGTKDLATGSSAVRLRQNSVTYLGRTNQQPCAICGGFCGDPPGGPRDQCATNADCGPKPGVRTVAVPCTLDSICSAGPDTDQPCRPDPPAGGGTEFFGTTSVDCAPPGSNISGSGIDILFNPITTGTVSRVPSFQCDALGFTGKRCVGGPNEGRTCTADSDCTPGTCNFQCFCPATPGSGVPQKPNDCSAACLGGANDKDPCTTDADCDPPNGFCHPADCRVNPLDTIDPNDGICTVGPTIGTCSVTRWKNCNDDGDCQIANAQCTGPGAPSACCSGPGTGTCGGGCVFCDPAETCVITAQQCFPGTGHSRQGVAHPTDPTGVSLFCETPTTAPSINTTAGLTGPAAILQPSTSLLVGFP